MSISKDGKVKLFFSRRPGSVLAGGLIVLQALLSLILVISLAANIIWPESGRAAAGTPMQISYEGRLTDSSGNALGGTGTPYCYRFSIYDAASAGNKLWPATATAATTTATTTDGVFSAIIGQADTLSSTVFDFSTTSVAYLQVEVNATPTTCSGSWETLSPRQQLLATPYALTANNIYGSYLKTDTINGRVQVGTGSGAATPIYLALDARNTPAEYVGQSCSPNGLMWYNSNASSTQALICENGVMAGLGIQGTTTIAAINANTGTPASVGTVNFNNANGVTFGIAGNIVTASVAAGGGGTISRYMWPQYGNLAAVTSVPQGSLSVQYYPIYEQLTATRMDVMMSISLATANNSSSAGMVISQWAGLYSLNASTLMSMSTTSYQQTISWQSNSGSYSSLTGVRLMTMPFGVNASPGDYFLAYELSTAYSSFSNGAKTTSLGGTSSIYGATMNTVAGTAMEWGLTNATSNLFGGMGVWSAQVNSNLGNLSLSGILQTGANMSKANFWAQFRGI